jgi:alpha-1,2-mannosyltransferase
VVGNIRRLLPQSTKLSEFYFVRYILAFVCALCQTLMYRVVSLTINPRIGVLFVMALVLSPGNFNASTAYLPSSFAMYFAMLGATAFMNWRGGIRTSWGMLWFGIAGVIGWPFAAALQAPYLAEEVFFALVSYKDAAFDCSIRILRGVVATGIVVV